MKLTSLLYDASRKIGKLASALYDVEVLASGDPKRIVKRAAKKGIRKKVYKGLNKALRKW